MSMIRDRTEDFKDAVNRGALSLGFDEVLILSEKLHSVTSQVDQLRAVRFQDAINRAMPRTKPKRPPVKASIDVSNNLEPREQTSSDTRDPSEIQPEPMKIKQQLLDGETRTLQVELSSLLDAARDTETKMVEMSTLNHLLSTHVLQQAQQIEYLYDQPVEATKNVEMGNKELTQAIQRNSSSRTFLLLFLVVTGTNSDYVERSRLEKPNSMNIGVQLLSCVTLFVSCLIEVQTTSSPCLFIGEVSGGVVIATSSGSMWWSIDMVSGLLVVDDSLSRNRETGKMLIDRWNGGGMLACCGDFYKDARSWLDDGSVVRGSGVEMFFAYIWSSKNGEGPSRRTRQTLHQRNGSRLQEVEVEPVSKHIIGSNRRSEHEGGGDMVPRETHGVHLQS
ncbi:hypothetical protein L1987_11590 [Smallanthus sonchifolius]|uniref:Uncharacterized protein n=1 Tax=Smallanthus sonchifolius TaxID=185202 RepID=A0ACB9JBR1_9ASTR|nr:hypothetical protein L1987_11590 [Smallanthus sonchifolius]